jgi:hypothetical protein
MNRDELISKLATKYIVIIGGIETLCLFGIFSSVFVFIWYESIIAFKIIATSVLVFLIAEFFKVVILKVITDFVDAQLKLNDEGKHMNRQSKFQIRLAKLIEESKN